MSMQSSAVYEAPPDSLEEAMAHKPVCEVQIDGVALLKIIKHCHEKLPTMVTGSLLGLDSAGVLEVSYAYPFPTPTIKGQVDADADNKHPIDGQEYQIEMMKLLRDVNIDNNCVGWYQSMYLGTVATTEVVAHQFNYQISEELSDNSILLAYDAAQSTNGHLVVKAFRLSADFLAAKKAKSNTFIKPSNMLEELPVRVKNGGLISAFLRDLHDASLETGDAAVASSASSTSSSSAHILNNYQFSALSMNNSEAYLERQMELIRLWMEDLCDLQQQSQLHSKQSVKPRLDHVRFLTKRLAENATRRENGEPELPLTTANTVLPNGVVLNDGVRPLPEAPQRADLLLTLKQLHNYCHQINDHINSNLQNLYVTSQVCASATTANAGSDSA